jgi:DNA-nicking Smr family endonuclease
VVERRRAVPGLDRRTTERLTKGQLPVEARLDLHGHRQATAHRALDAFILASHRAGRRCVLVVTGKGQGRADAPAPIMGDEAPGVLRRNLPRWLAEPGLADKVLAIRPALPQHGGEGAFYVLLRRSR